MSAAGRQLPERVSGVHPVPGWGTTLGTVAAEIRALAQRTFDPLGREDSTVTVALGSDTGDARYRASVVVSRHGPPIERSGETAEVALMALLGALRAHESSAGAPLGGGLRGRARG